MSSKQPSSPSLTSIRKVLQTAAFDPRKPGLLSTIVSLSDRAYLEKRAIEFIQEAESDRIAYLSRGKTIFDEEDYRKKLRRAIQCLALAIIKE
jgi:hypothetical protein